jgi:hypothetical protein
MNSYIYYQGGQYGDLVFSIINNGIHLPAWVQTKLKTNYSASDEKFKNFILKIPIKTITGCASFPLKWGFDNYQLVCTDKDICAFSVTRLLKLNANVDLKLVLKAYYDTSFTTYIDSLPELKTQELLIKKYQTYMPNPDVPSLNLINLNYIYDKKKFIDELATFFTFDIELAELQYDQWYERELPLLDEFFKSV